MNPAKQKNIDFFFAHKSEWLKDPLRAGKFIVIHAEQIKGAFDTFDAALRSASSQFPAEEFVVQQLIDESAQVNFYASAR